MPVPNIELAGTGSVLRTAEVISQRIQGIRLMFDRCRVSFRCDKQHGRVAAIQLQLPAAQPSVGSQEIVKSKNLVFQVVQSPAAYQTHIRHLLLALERVWPPAFAALSEF
jgi:hypothetical protein